MRTLPDNPSLDFLRREAKELRASLRESSPEATLADAQKALAEQYSYRSWTEMKAEVDRRRANVHAGDPGLAALLAAAFGLGAVSGPLLPVALELQGRSWQLQTRQGRFLLSPVFGWVTAEPGVRLMEAARSRGVEAPEAVRSPSGLLVEVVAGGHWRAERWLDLGPSPKNPIRSTIAHHAGEILGILHDLAIPADGPIHPFLTYRRPEAEWHALIDRARAANVGWLSEFETALPAILELSSVGTDAPTTGLTTCPAFQPENVRTNRKGDLVVVNQDFAGAGVREWSFAGALPIWTDDGRHLPAARAFAEGYRSSVGELPRLDLSSFTTPIVGWLNYTHAQICGAIGDVGDETPEEILRSEREARGVLRDPMSIAKLERVLASLAHA